MVEGPILGTGGQAAAEELARRVRSWRSGPDSRQITALKRTLNHSNDDIDADIVYDLVDPETEEQRDEIARRIVAAFDLEAVEEGEQLFTSARLVTHPVRAAREAEPNIEPEGIDSVGLNDLRDGVEENKLAWANEIEREVEANSELSDAELRERFPEQTSEPETTTPAPEPGPDRSDVLKSAKEKLRESGVELDGLTIDVINDATEIVVVDNETNESRTVEFDGNLTRSDTPLDLGSDEITTLDPDSSARSNDTTSNVPSVDNLGGGRLAAAVAIGAAIIYGVTQS